jgi:hypothetical protein
MFVLVFNIMGKCVLSQIANKYQGDFRECSNLFNLSDAAFDNAEFE